MRSLIDAAKDPYEVKAAKIIVDHVGMATRDQFNTLAGDATEEEKREHVAGDNLDADGEYNEYFDEE
jgi:hypothetical protein